jgi:hypothetical protein
MFIQADSILQPGIAAAGGLFLALAAAGVSAAANFQERSAQPAPILPECTCRYQGQNLPLGAHICLMTSEGPRLAECVREVNVTSWRPGGESCTLSGRPLPRICRATDRRVPAEKSI